MLSCVAKARAPSTLLRTSLVNSSSSLPYSFRCRRFSMGSNEKDDIEKAYEATKVEYRRLGNSGFKVSVPILGAMSFGDKRWAPWVIEEEEAYPLLKAAYDRGLTTWDTANMYSNGASEEIIGKALKKFNIPRHKVFILTKCWTYVGEKPGDSTMSHSDIVPQTKDYVNQGGLSRGAIFRAVENSLKRLQTDYIDLLQIHRFDPEVPVEETMEALNDLVRWGKVHYIGASSMWAYRFAQLQFAAEKNGWTKFISMQNHYSLLYREEEREMLKFCNDTGVGVIPWGPLFAGMLARPLESHGSTERSSNKAAPTEMQKKIVGRVEELAKKKGWSMTVVALAWIKTKCSSPIVGFSSVKRIDEAIEVTGKNLTEEEIKYLEEPYQAQAVIGHS